MEFEHPEIPSGYESLMTFFLMPVILYCGFGRALIASEKKSVILQVAYAQEILLHTLPLGMLLIQNNLELEKISNFDIVCLSVLGTNLVQVFIEIVLSKIYENVHINLELRQAMKSLTRVEDLIKISLVCAFFFSTTLLVGLFAFEDQGCVRGFFEENSICKDCKAFVD